MVVVEVHPRWIGTAVGAVHLRGGPTIVVCIVSYQLVLFYLFDILWELSLPFFYIVNVQCW